ncbi:DNA repair protein RecO [Brevirhabdus sp.]|uniref:DNA repair protein RecO n=1 Tax=Brevirhabdus sp. TaxID=2004514 RepID=UPI00405A41BB
MEWRDQGAVLSVRRHGENAAIIEVLTRDHGRHAGVVRGGAGRRLAPVLQPGAQLDLRWHARLEDHLGAFVVEPVQSRSALLADRLALAGLNAVCSLVVFALPEREPHPRLYTLSIALLDALEQTPGWPLDYLHWEVLLLEELGFGLDLSRCAVTGGASDLLYVSPRSGRAVSAGAAGPWREQLLPNPACLSGAGAAGVSDLLAGLRTTGHFLAHRLAPSLGDRPLPPARQRLLDQLARLSGR